MNNTYSIPIAYPPLMQGDGDFNAVAGVGSLGQFYQNVIVDNSETVGSLYVISFTNLNNISATNLITNNISTTNLNTINISTTNISTTNLMVSGQSITSSPFLGFFGPGSSVGTNGVSSITFLYNVWTSGSTIARANSNYITTAGITTGGIQVLQSGLYLANLNIANSFTTGMIGFGKLGTVGFISYKDLAFNESFSTTNIFAVNNLTSVLNLNANDTVYAAVSSIDNNTAASLSVCEFTMLKI